MGLYDNGSMQHMDATFFLGIYYVAYAQGWIKSLCIKDHFITFMFLGVRGIKRNVECGGFFYLFVLTETSRGLMCGDNSLSYVQLLQHKDNSLRSKRHT